MNRDDIWRMAIEAGYAYSWSEAANETLERFAALVAAAERESCAKVAEEWQLGVDDPRYQQSCAAAIRARGNT